MICLATADDLYRPIWYKNLINSLNNQPTYPGLLHILEIILGLNALSWLFWRLGTIWDIKAIADVMKSLNETCFTYLHKHSYGFFSDSFVGTLVRRVNRYSRSLEELSDQWAWNIETAIISIVVITGVLFARSVWLGLAILVWTGFYLWFSFWYANFKFQFDAAASAADSTASGHLADTITNNLNMKLFGGFAGELKQYRHLTGALYDALQKTWYMEEFGNAVKGLFIVLLEFGMFYIAIHLWFAGKITTGDLVLLQIYVLQIFDKLWNVGKNIHKVYEALADSKEMTEILLTPHEIVDQVGAAPLEVSQGKIVFDEVNFSYAKGKSVLTNFSLTIEPGQRIALIGPSGGGKSTIVKLLLRFMDVTSGTITIDGQDTAKVGQDTLRDQIALVPQDPLLFHRSLMENIRYAKPEASDEEVIAAAKAAHCHEFISTFPTGYDTFVGERGVKLSGGERQRVALARAFLRNAPILVLDEATSNLDSQSEHFIQESLHKLMRGRTVIVIAHRLSTIRQMDRIYVLANGKIQESGSHNELLEIEEGTYQKLWNIQVGGFQKN